MCRTVGPLAIMCFVVGKCLSGLGRDLLTSKSLGSGFISSKTSPCRLLIENAKCGRSDVEKLGSYVECKSSLWVVDIYACAVILCGHYTSSIW